MRQLILEKVAQAEAMLTEAYQLTRDREQVDEAIAAGTNDICDLLDAMSDMSHVMKGNLGRGDRI